jgi:threonine dehydratase
VPPAGVVAASGGNHGVAVAYAAHRRGVPATIFVPTVSAPPKMERIRRLGADLVVTGERYADALAAAQDFQRGSGAMSVHAYDQRETITGQGTLGLELAGQVDGLDTVLVPVGGGGLISGVALAVKTARPEVEVIGVQAQTCAPVAASLAAGHPVAVDSALTIADGIAVKRPGELTLAMIERWVDRIVAVGEDDLAEAMVFLLERAKLVVEGAGAVGVAALLSGEVGPVGSGTTAVILSGGNVDPGLLAQIARRHESQAGRRLVLLASLPDRPGSLARLLALVGERGANLLDVEHIREGFDLHVRESAVQLVLETRGPEHARQVVTAVREAGYTEPRAIR